MLKKKKENSFYTRAAFFFLARAHVHDVLWGCLGLMCGRSGVRDCNTAARNRRCDRGDGVHVQELATSIAEYGMHSFFSLFTLSLCSLVHSFFSSLGSVNQSTSRLFVCVHERSSCEFPRFFVLCFFFLCLETDILQMKHKKTKKRLIERFACNNELGLLIWSVEYLGCIFHKRVFQKALTNNNLNICDYLFEKNCDWSPWGVEKFAKHVEVITWLHEKEFLLNWRKVYEVAAENGVLQFFPNLAIYYFRKS